MNFRPRLSKNTLIFGGAATWGLLLISCVAVNRTMIAPPFVAGADFVGTKSCAECHADITDKFSTATHSPAKCRTFKGQSIKSDALIWAAKQPEPNPYQLEWDNLVDAIRNNKPYNEIKRGVEASVVTSMGRFAAHTGQKITFDEFLNHDHEFAPDVAKMTPDGPAPVKGDKDWKYPIPQPGVNKKREYQA